MTVRPQGAAGVVPVMRLVLCLLLVACKHYDRDRLTAVCDGSGYADVAAYDPAATSGRPLAVVKRWVDAPTWTLDTPKELGVAPTADNYKDVSLALCVDQAAGAFDRECQMDAMDATIEVGGGDPKVTTHARPGQPKPIRAYAAKYTLTLRQAKTGAVVATTQIDAPVEHCPLVVLGSSPNDYAELPDGALAKFLAPYVKR